MGAAYPYGNKSNPRNFLIPFTSTCLSAKCFYEAIINQRVRGTEIDNDDEMSPDDGVIPAEYPSCIQRAEQDAEWQGCVKRLQLEHEATVKALVAEYMAAINKCVEKYNACCSNCDIIYPASEKPISSEMFNENQIFREFCKRSCNRNWLDTTVSTSCVSKVAEEYNRKIKREQIYWEEEYKKIRSSPPCGEYWQNAYNSCLAPEKNQLKLM